MKDRLWRWFVPHIHNDFTPDLLQRTALLLMGSLAVLTFTMSNLYALLWQQSAWLTSAVLPAVVVDKTNIERKSERLAPLVRNSVLDEAARLKAEDMAKNGYFAHYSPKGVSPWYWFDQAGYTYVHAGENLAVHFTDSKEVVEAWMNSPTHRANIVNQNYREIGVGTATGTYEGYDTIFVVQLFGTPGQVAQVDVSPAPIVVTPAPLATIAETTSPETFALAARDTQTVAGIEATSPNSEAESLLAPRTPVVESKTPPAEPLSVAATTVEDHGVVVSSDTITTSSDLIEVPIDAQLTTKNPVGVNEMSKLATSPSSMLQRVYWCIGLLAIVALVLSVLVEWRQQRPVQVFYGVALLYVMAALFYVHSWVTSGALIT